MTATSAPPRSPQVQTPEELYLDLLKNVLTRFILGEHFQRVEFPIGSLPHAVFAPVRRLFAMRDWVLMKRHTDDPQVREEGKDWPADGETMIGLRRLDNIQECVTDVLRRGVPGDLIETGVWRGGAVILMRAILKAYGDTSRTVWVADSFEGLPKPDAEHYPADANDPHWSFAPLAVSLEQVQANFARYGLLDGQVRFLKGWFKDTLPTAPIERIAVMRLDGDMYESTMDALKALYPKLSVGGYVLIDDYGQVPACKQAVHDYRTQHGITEEIRSADWSGTYWRRER